MKIKGTGLKTTRDFIKENFPNAFDRWFQTLPDSSKELYKGTIGMSEWFPLKEGFLDPLDHIIKFFYNGDVTAGAEAVGKYSAEAALKGVYKVFLLIASPAFLIKRASKIIATYYDPSEVEAFETGKKDATIHITKFDEINQALEIRVAAWCVRALEMTGCSNVKYEIKKSLAKKEEFTEIHFSWD